MAHRDRSAATRELILSTAERLYAEHGIRAVSNRQISEAAGQGNSTAVGYHFGTKADLVRAITRKHTDQMEQARMDLVIEATGSTDIHDWVACHVRPLTEHLAALGRPTWYARFYAQTTTDPALQEIVVEEALTSASLRLLLVGLGQCLPGLPPSVSAERWVMARHLIAHMCVEQERALADGGPADQPSWPDLAERLTGAVAALWLAPVTDRRPAVPRRSRVG